MSGTDSIIQDIRRNPRIPAPSQAVCRVLELTRDEDCDMKRVGEVIGKDAGLTGQLLRQANSALYGCRTATSSVTEACIRLGIKQVRAAVLNHHVVNGLGKARPPGFDPNRYWQAAFATSVAAKELCGELAPAMAEDAGTAGLLCDIGIGLLAYGVPQKYQVVLDQLQSSEGSSVQDIEARVLGVSHPEVGAAVLDDWNLDEPMIEAVRAHHSAGPIEKQSPSGEMAAIVSAAVTFSEIALEGSDMDRVETLFGRLERVSKDPDAVVARLLDRLVSRIQLAARAMSVELGSIGEMERNFEGLAVGLPAMSEHLATRAVP